jgi:predicted dehydrogenase
MHIEVGIIGINRGVQAGQDFPTTPVPAGFDYDLWLGPAPLAPFSPQRVARGNETCYWYYISDYTVGFISGNGVHFVDIAQWGMKDDVMPVGVHTPWTQIPTQGLIDDAIAWRAEVRYSNGVKMSYSSEGHPHPDGIRFIGTEGWVHVTGGGTLTGHPASVVTSTIKPEEIHLQRSEEHHRNFLDCIKTRQRAAASAQIGHNATTTCNLVEIAARVGRPVSWDAQAERFVNDDVANRLCSRPMRTPWQL